MIGALIGKQEGRNIEVMNSFELMSHTIDEKVHIDKEYYYTKEEQCKNQLFHYQSQREQFHKYRIA